MPGAGLGYLEHCLSSDKEPVEWGSGSQGRAADTESDVKVMALCLFSYILGTEEERNSHLYMMGCPQRPRASMRWGIYKPSLWVAMVVGPDTMALIQLSLETPGEI